LPDVFVPRAPTFTGKRIIFHELHKKKKSGTGAPFVFFPVFAIFIGRIFSFLFSFLRFHYPFFPGSPVSCMRPFVKLRFPFRDQNRSFFFPRFFPTTFSRFFLPPGPLIFFLWLYPPALFFASRCLWFWPGLFHGRNAPQLLFRWGHPPRCGVIFHRGGPVLLPFLSPGPERAKKKGAWGGRRPISRLVFLTIFF